MSRADLKKTKKKYNYANYHHRPPEAPLYVCPDFCGFEGPKMALGLSVFRGFETGLRTLALEVCPLIADSRGPPKVIIVR
jgi:hypothetical protein